MPFSPLRLSIAFAAAHVWLVTQGAAVHFPCRNEVAHLPAGLSVWQTGEFHLYRVNPPLPRVLLSLPTLTLRPNASSIESVKSVDTRDEWSVARRFANDNRDAYLPMMRVARSASLCWSLLAAWVVWKWADELYGPRGACLATAIWCLGPTVNAHSQVAGPDMPAAAAGLVAMYLFRRFLRRPTWASAAFAGTALGVAQLCKFTMLVLYPVCATQVVIIAFLYDRRRSDADPALVLVRSLAAFALGLVVINCGYLFQGTLLPLGEYPFVSQSLAGPLGPGQFAGNRFRGTLLADLPVPLPFDYLSGIDVQRKDFETLTKSYLGGEWRPDGGWWYYYLYALAVKTPAGILLIVTWSAALCLFRHPANAGWRDELALWLSFATILALVSSQTGLNRHSRYALPALPFAVVATAKLGYFLAPGRRRAGAVILASAAWAAVDVARSYPHTLSYFNAVSGGPAFGDKHLLDSNIDWGQDLLLFKRWVESNPDARPIHLAYENFVDYEVAGLPALPAIPADYKDLRPGYYALDIHSLYLPCYTHFRSLDPFWRVGYSIRVYKIGTDGVIQPPRVR